MKRALRLTLLAGVTLAIGLLPVYTTPRIAGAASVQDTVNIANQILGLGRQCIALTGNRIIADYNAYGKASFNASKVKADAQATKPECLGAYGALKQISVPSAIPYARLVKNIQTARQFVMARCYLGADDMWHVAARDGKKTIKDAYNDLSYAAGDLQQEHQYVDQLKAALQGNSQMRANSRLSMQVMAMQAPVAFKKCAGKRLCKK